MKTHFLSKRFFLTLACIVYFITAFNSHGYYHGDEHYQIIEFAGLKLGTHTPGELAWEFKTKIRPTLQPTIAFLLLKSIKGIGIADPYQQVFILRLLTALLSLICITYFIKQTDYIFKDKWVKRCYYFISYFLWFIPFLSVRFSSEVWSGLFFLLSIGLIHSNKQNAVFPFLIGFAFGFSFLFRFQLAICIVPALLWLLFVKKVTFNFLIKVMLGFALVFMIGIIIDSWFYNEFVFTAWNYFRVQLLEGAASSFGTSPWYFYLQKIITYPSVFIGIPLVLAFVVVIIRYPKSVFLWCTLSFLIVHSIILHKEERFMFPIAFLFPVILSIGIMHFYAFAKRLRFTQKMADVIGIVLIGVNIIGVIVLATKSAGLGRMTISKYIHEEYGRQAVNLISTDWSNPYNPWQSLQTKFYLEDDLNSQRIGNLCGYNDSLLVRGKVNLLVMRMIDLNDENCNKEFNSKDFYLIKQSVPLWIQKINKIYKGLDDRNIFLLYKIENS